MEHPPLLTKTLELLEKCDLPLAELAKESNLGYEWLKKLKGGSIPDPSVNRIQILHDFLVQRATATEAPRT